VSVNLALCWGNLGQEEQTLQMLRAVVEENPDHVVALRSLGKILLQQQQPAEAERWLRRALRTEPQDYRSHWLLSGALQQQGKTAEAEQQLDRARQLELSWQRLRKITSKELAARPHDAALQAELGALLLDLGYNEAGRNWLLSALQEDPNCAARAALERLNQKRAANHKEQSGPAR
jgi:tetratricopeptide (TPR) repeat protein